jgi:hypothetical protein
MAVIDLEAKAEAFVSISVMGPLHRAMPVSAKANQAEVICHTLTPLPKHLPVCS